MVGSVCVNDLICVHLQVHCSNCHCVLVEHKSYEVTKPRCDNNSYLGQRKGSHCCVAIYPESKSVLPSRRYVKTPVRIFIFCCEEID